MWLVLTVTRDFDMFLDSLKAQEKKREHERKPVGFVLPSVERGEIEKLCDAARAATGRPKTLERNRPKKRGRPAERSANRTRELSMDPKRVKARAAEKRYRDSHREKRRDADKRAKRRKRLEV